MIEEEVRELYVHLTFQYESVIDTLLAKRLIDMYLAIVAKENVCFLSGQINFAIGIIGNRDGIK